ncbi:GNAT family N-acetyltransferase [Ramlibacter sp.]|uniref:GNAT family N-acetyltransferase n=1 Tax=Ramlibacter sp. TaxID=1917967 RepID=UPI001798E269|nr:GNAT family N-acetyltransferase [Ramlibacter sp.]MBA2674695.1 GNAT family N-acetyltransferase [Ramlibacter sp.]
MTTTTIAWSDALDGVDWNELAAMYRIAMGNKLPDDLRRTFGNSMFRCFVRDGGKLVGAGRALADGVDCSYICDVAVLPSHQGTGLGKEIVQRLVDASRGHRKIILYAVPGKEGFYRKFGFRRMRTAMGIFGDEADAVRRGYIDPD